LRQILVWKGKRPRVIEPADPALTEGFHPFESDNNFRWTDGNARLPPGCFTDGAQALRLNVATMPQYPCPDDQDAVVA